MKIKNYKKRLIDSTIDLYLKTFGAIYIEGPKWCGKTWTSRYHANSEFLLADPKNNFSNKNLAALNLNFALDGSKPRLIDEWQELPQIWDAVRGEIDKNPIRGSYILTGSSAINKDAYVHSGTGRIARLKMRPMSLFESGVSEGTISLKDICKNIAKDKLTRNVVLNEIVELIISGGWPLAIGLPLNQSSLLAREYVKSLLNEDIYKVDDIKRDKHKIELFLKSLARNESTTITNSKIKSDINEFDSADVNLDTITSYSNLMNNLYITDNIPPFSYNIRSSLRVKQSEKRHFVDPSLPSAILNLTKDKLIDDLELLGFLFESLVLRDLLIYVDTFDAKLFHYQDYDNNEIDAVIELDDGSWTAIEIKLGSNQIDEASKKLIKINNKIKEKGGKPASSLCVICGLTNGAYRRKDGVYVVPITSLKN